MLNNQLLHLKHSTETWARVIARDEGMDPESLEGDLKQIVINAFQYGHELSDVIEDPREVEDVLVAE